MSELRFPDALLDRIRSAVPISQVVGQYVTWDQGKSQPGRGDMWACCPFHAERDPSFHVLDQDGIYKCFVCTDSAGDVFDFLVQVSGISFVDAVKTVAGMAGIDIDQPKAPQTASAARPALPPAKVTNRPAQEPKAPKRQRQGKWSIFKAYDYEIDGVVQYQNVRIQFKMPDGSWEIDPDTGKPDKDFRQRRPSGLGDGSWVWGLKAGQFMRRKAGDDWRKLDEAVMAEWGTGERLTMAADVPHGLYRRSEVEIAIAEGKTVLFLEGEKAVDAAWDIGQAATCNSGGGENFTADMLTIFRGARVVASPDNDPQRRDNNGDLVFHPDGRPSFKGKDHAEQFCAMVRGKAAFVGLLELPGLPLKGDIVEWIAAGGTAGQLAQMLHTLPAWRPSPPVSKFGAKRTTELAGKPIIYDWLVKGLVERNGVLMFAGEKQSAKTFAVMDMGFKIARNLPYGDRKTRQGVVIHMACEDGKGVQMRAEGYRIANDMSPEADVPYVVMDPNADGTTRFSLMSDESVDGFIKECLDWRDYYGQPLEFIIIDTLSKATEGLNEIDGAEVGKVLARVDRIRLKTGATVCLVHHMNASGQRMRGHSSLGDNVPNVIEIKMLTKPAENRRDPPVQVLDGEGREVRQLVLTKNKNGLNNLKWKIVLQVVHLGYDQDGDEQTTCVCVSPKWKPRDEKEERHKLSPDTRLVFDALQAALIDAGQDLPPGMGNGVSGVRCAPLAAFEASVRKTMAFTASEDEIEARNSELKTFIKRTTTTLINAGYMGRDNDQKIVWWTGKSSSPRPRYQEAERPQEQPGAGIADEVKQEIMDSGVPF